MIYSRHYKKSLSFGVPLFTLNPNRAKNIFASALYLFLLSVYMFRETTIRLAPKELNEKPHNLFLTISNNIALPEYSHLWTRQQLQRHSLSRRHRTNEDETRRLGQSSHRQFR